MVIVEACHTFVLHMAEPAWEPWPRFASPMAHAGSAVDHVVLDLLGGHHRRTVNARNDVAVRLGWSRRDRRAMGRVFGALRVAQSERAP